MYPLLGENFCPPKVLILDDSEFDRARIRRILKAPRFPCQITEVDSITAFGVALLQETFDIAFLDYDLPDGTGVDALKQLSTCVRNSKALPIVVTGNQGHHIAAEASEQGCLSCLSKDELNPDVLTYTISNVIRVAR